MRKMTSASMVVVALGVLSILAAACGPRTGGRGTAGGPVTETGAPVSAKTMESFSDAFQQYEQAKAGGLDEGECSSVSRQFEKVSDQVESGLPEALFNVGAVWQECGDSAKAKTYFERANTAAKAHSKGKSPGFAPALVWLGVYEYRDGNRGPAKRFFDQAREADRRSEAAYTNLAVLQGEEAYQIHKARGLESAYKAYRDAQTDLRRALAVNSDFMTAFAQMALLYLEIAEDNEQMLDITELVCQQATARAREIKSRPSEVAPIYNIWGLALIRKGDVVRAVEQFDSARRLNPDFFEAHMNYGAVNLSFRGFEAAEEAFRQAVRLRPEDYEAQLSLGAALRGRGQLGEARAAYEKARGIDGARPHAYYNLAVLMQDYEMSNAGGMDAQIALLGKAKQVYRSFLQKCQAKRGYCVRRRPGMEDQDMTDEARRRIKACDETVAGLREAQQLAAEAERMTKEAEKAPPPPPPTEAAGGGEGGEGEGAQ